MRERTSGASSSSTEAEGPSWALDGRTRRLGARGEVLLGGEPFRLVRLSETGAAVLDRLLCDLVRARLVSERPDGSRPSTTARGAAGLARQLADGGLIHPVPSRRRGLPGEVAFVVPVREDPYRLDRLLRALGTGSQAVVVDDGSGAVSSARIAEVARARGAVALRRSVSGGPAAARNLARLHSAVRRSGLVAFVDCDVVPSEDWLEPIIGHFADERVGAVAPRVTTAPGTAGRRVAAYEALMSPLDLGSAPGAVGSHRRLSYVPAAALVCRREALEEVGWFDESLRVGEDVDLVRRLAEAGWVVRYEPRAFVAHDSRRGLWQLARQRFAYGSSAAALELRHPGTVAPLEASLGSMLGVIGVGLAAAGVASAAGADRAASTGSAAGNPRRRAAVPRHAPVATAAAGTALWLGITSAFAASLRRRFRCVGCPTPAGRALGTVLRGQVFAAAGVVTALRRVWWPILGTVAATPLPRVRRLILLMLGVSEVAAHVLVRLRSRSAGVPPKLGLLSHLGLGVLDDVAYGAGVAAGCLRARSARAFLPRLSPESPTPAAGSRAAGHGRPLP